MQSLDEERQRHPLPFVKSVAEPSADVEFGFQGFDAEQVELSARQSLVEAPMIELMLLRREAQPAFTLISDPLPRTYLPEPREIQFEGSQGLLPQIRLSLLLHGS